jgi:regulator of RNase E activity RraB
MPVSALIVIGLFGIFLMLRGQKREAVTSSLPPADGDAATLDQLAHAGSDLTREHNIEFFLYLPDEESAQAVARQLQEEGVLVEVSRAADGADWLCLVKQRMIPDMAGLRGFRERLTAVAQAHNGEYDGWGTEVEDG